MNIERRMTSLARVDLTLIVRPQGTEADHALRLPVSNPSRNTVVVEKSRSSSRARTGSSAMFCQVITPILADRDPTGAMNSSDTR